MKPLIKWTIDNTPAMNTLMAAILVVGGVSLFLLHREVFPEFELEIVLVTVPYPGASPEEVEQGIVLAVDEDACIRFINDYAHEHLMIHSKDLFKYLGTIKHAGEILLGRDTPITLGNYLLGPNAVLPTSGAARIHSPLGVHDFLKTTGIGYVTSGAYDLLAKHAHTLAVYEGFDGHALAVSELRKKLMSKP